MRVEDWKLYLQGSADWSELRFDDWNNLELAHNILLDQSNNLFLISVRHWSTSWINQT